MAGRDVRFAVDVSPPQAVAWADGARLHQVLANLLDNAARHSPPGGTVQVTARSGPHGLHLEVADDGPGVAPADRDRVFDRFYRGGPAAAGGGGTGLGLAIARWAVALHGGRIGLADEHRQPVHRRPARSAGGGSMTDASDARWRAPTRWPPSWPGCGPTTAGRSAARCRCWRSLAGLVAAVLVPDATPGLGILLTGLAIGADRAAHRAHAARGARGGLRRAGSGAAGRRRGARRALVRRPLPARRRRRRLLRAGAGAHPGRRPAGRCLTARWRRHDPCRG